MTATAAPTAEHNPGWAAIAAGWIARLYMILDGLAGGAEHVGPTAVPGIPAPPVMDVAIRLTPTANVSTVIKRLTADGWAFEADHGDQGGIVFTQPHHAGGTAARLHVVGSEQPLWDRLIGIRDVLRADPSLATRYAHLQRDPDTYSAAVGPFLAAIAGRFGPATHTPVVRRVRAMLITPNGKILAVRRTKPAESVHWVLAGGGIEPADDSLETAAIREVIEETGGKPDLHRLVHIAAVAGHAHGSTDVIR